MLRKLRVPEHASLDAIGPAAVALADGAVGLHTGILYRPAGDGTPRVLHLAFHHQLRSEPPSDGWRWVVPDLDAYDLEYVAALCRLIADNPANRDVPYAFRFIDSGIAEDGSVLVGTSDRGLTCATFVLAIFRAVGVELLALDAWSTRPADVAAQERLLEYLEGRDRAQHEAVRSQVGCRRYRAEVVAAATAAPRPVAFAIAEALGGAGRAAVDAAARADAASEGPA